MMMMFHDALLSFFSPSFTRLQNWLKPCSGVLFALLNLHDSHGMPFEPRRYFL